MIETMERSSDNVLGYVMSGDITKADYETLVPAVAAAVEAHGSVSLLFDLTDFHWEKMSAWKSDMDFGKDYHDKIVKMAIVGDKGWEKHLTKLADRYYAEEAKYFEAADDAWDWLEG